MLSNYLLILTFLLNLTLSLQAFPVKFSTVELSAGLARSDASAPQYIVSLFNEEEPAADATGVVDVRGAPAVAGRQMAMTDAKGRRFSCLIPAPEEVDEEQEEVAAAAALNDPELLVAAAALLRRLAGTCLYREEGLWTYEVCYRDRTRQFRVDPTQASVNSPTEDFSCGSFAAGFSSGGGNGDASRRTFTFAAAGEQPPALAALPNDFLITMAEALGDGVGGAGFVFQGIGGDPNLNPMGGAGADEDEDVWRGVVSADGIGEWELRSQASSPGDSATSPLDSAAAGPSAGRSVPSPVGGSVGGGGGGGGEVGSLGVVKKKQEAAAAADPGTDDEGLYYDENESDDDGDGENGEHGDVRRASRRDTDRSSSRRKSSSSIESGSSTTPMPADLTATAEDSAKQSLGSPSTLASGSPSSDSASDPGFGFPSVSGALPKTLAPLSSKAAVASPSPSSGPSSILSSAMAAAVEETGLRLGRDADTSPYPELFVSQVYDNGAPCTMTGKPRSTEVRFACVRDPPSAGVALVSVRELPTCRYVFVVSAPPLCSLKPFRPRPAPSHHIQCRPVPVE